MKNTTTAAARSAEVLRILDGGKQFSANHIGWLLYKAGMMGGKRGGKGNFILGASAVLRSMKRKGLVGCYRRGHDQWAVLLWYVDHEVRKTIKKVAV